jgi:multicopper oxidase
MTVIEVEGTNTQPLQIDSLRIFAGAYGLIQGPCSANRCQNSSTLFYCRMFVISSFHRVRLIRL